MKRNKACWIAGLILVTSICLLARGSPLDATLAAKHAPGSFRAVSEYVASLHLPRDWEVQTADGDLNGDGLPDAVVLTVGHGRCLTGQIHVLMRITDQALVSSTFTDLGCNANLVASVAIKSGSIFVTMDTPKGADVRYQFRWNKGMFELIGLQAQFAEGGLNDEPFFASSTDFNLRTGDAFFKRDVDMGLSDSPAPVDKRPTRVHAKGPTCSIDKLKFELDFCVNKWKAGEVTVSELMLIR